MRSLTIWKHLPIAGLVVVLLLCVVFCAPLSAQHKFTVGTAIDVVGAGDDNPQFSGLPVRQAGEMKPSYGLYPSVTFDLLGGRSSLNANYAYGWQKTESTTDLQSESHAASLSFSRRFSPYWTLSISDSFSVTDDAQTFYALRGVLPTPEGYTFVFSPVAADVTSRTNNVTVGVDHPFNARSSLQFSGSHSLRNYGNTSLRGLSNQHDIGAGGSYTHRTSERTSWNFGYDMSRYQFDQYSDATSHAVHMGMSSRISRNTSFGWSAGVSRVGNGQSSSSASYIASATLEKTIQKNLFQLSVSQDNAAATGLGSLSRSRTAQLGFSRALGRWIGLFASASVFDSKAILDNTFDARGGNATANVGFNLSRRFSLQVGGQYQRYTKPVTYQFTQRRVFISLRYTHENLLHSN